MLRRLIDKALVGALVLCCSLVGVLYARVSGDIDGLMGSNVEIKERLAACEGTLGTVEKRLDRIEGKIDRIIENKRP